MGRVLRWREVQISRREVDAACAHFKGRPDISEAIRRDADSYAGGWFRVELPEGDAAMLAGYLSDSRKAAAA